MSFLYRFFYESLLQPDDDFFTRSRKIMIAVMAVVDVYCLYLLYVVSEYVITHPNFPNLITNLVAMSIIFLSLLGCWLYTKRTRTVPDALMDVWLLGTNTSFILIVIGRTGYPWVPMFQMLATLADGTRGTAGRPSVSRASTWTFTTRRGISKRRDMLTSIG